MTARHTAGPSHAATFASPPLAAAASAALTASANPAWRLGTAAYWCRAAARLAGILTGVAAGPWPRAVEAARSSSSPAPARRAGRDRHRAELARRDRGQLVADAAGLSLAVLAIAAVVAGLKARFGEARAGRGRADDDPGRQPVLGRRLGSRAAARAGRRPRAAAAPAPAATCCAAPASSTAGTSRSSPPGHWRGWLCCSSPGPVRAVPSASAPGRSTRRWEVMPLERDLNPLS